SRQTTQYAYHSSRNNQKVCFRYLLLPPLIKLKQISEKNSFHTKQRSFQLKIFIHYPVMSTYLRGIPAITCYFISIAGCHSVRKTTNCTRPRASTLRRIPCVSAPSGQYV